MERFYGWQTAPKAANELYDLLKPIWAADTCAPRMRAAWSAANPTKGQCSITAFLVQDLLGGEVYGVPLGDGNYHCYNVVDGCVFDLTSAQFGGVQLDYACRFPQSREVHFVKEEKRQRYELLKSRLLSRMAENGKPAEKS